MRRLRNFLLLALGFCLLFTAYMYSAAIRDPVVRSDTLSIAAWPKGEPPARILLLSDLHVAAPDMPPARVKRLVEQINMLKPDLILFAGDFVSDKIVATHHYPGKQALAPLAGLKPRYGTVAVLGNHDYWRDQQEIETALAASNIMVLRNDAVRAGPFIVGGVDDDFTGHARVSETVARMDRLQGIPIIVSHSPDIMPQVPDRIALIVAGHTHCGQINIPGLDTLASVTRFGRHYACGKVREGGKTLYVSAGLGTSILPLRFRPDPDMWLLTVGD